MKSKIVSDICRSGLDLLSKSYEKEIAGGKEILKNHYNKKISPIMLWICRMINCLLLGTFE